MRSSASKRLAKALVEIGREDNAYARYGTELRGVASVFRATPELMKVLLNPMYKLDERKALAAKVASSAGVSGPVARFLDILVASRSIRNIEDITDAYTRFEDELAGRLKATVESPSALDAALVEEIRAKIRAATGKDVDLTHRTRPELIGGLVVRIDNTILDGSLKTQLERMKEKILEGVV